MKFCLNLFLYALLLLGLNSNAFAQFNLPIKQRPTQPHVADLLQDASYSGGDTPLRQLEENDFAQLDRFIEVAEAAYPGLIFAFLGRDTAPLARAVEARYTAKGEPNRVVNIPLSGPSVRSMNDEQIVEFLVQSGLNPMFTSSTRPFILIDRTEFKKEDYVRGGYLYPVSQTALLLSAVYRSYDQLGLAAADYTKHFNAISVYADRPSSESLFHTSYPGVAKTFVETGGAEKLYRRLSGSKTQLLVPDQILGVPISKAFIDRSDLEWHDSFGAVSRPFILGKNQPLRVSIPINDAEDGFGKRISALALTIEVWQNSLNRLNEQSASPLMKKIFPVFFYQEQNKLFPSLLSIVQDPQTTWAQKYEILRWSLDLGQASESGYSENLLSFVKKFFGEESSEKSILIDEILKLKNGNAKTHARYFEIMALGEFLREVSKVPAESAVQDLAMDRLQESLQRWITFEGANGSSLSGQQLSLLNRVLGGEAENKSWSLSFLKRRGANIDPSLDLENVWDREKDRRATQEERKVNILSSGRDWRKDPLLKVQLAIVGSVNAVIAASTFLPGMEVQAALMLAAVIDFAALKSFKDAGYFPAVSAALRSLKMTIAGLRYGILPSSSSKTGKKFLEVMQTNYSEAAKACTLTLQKK